MLDGDPLTMAEWLRTLIVGALPVLLCGAAAGMVALGDRRERRHYTRGWRP